MQVRDKVYQVSGQRLDEREVIHLMQLCMMAGGRLAWLEHVRHEGLEEVVIEVEADADYIYMFESMRPSRWSAFNPNMGNIKIQYEREVGKVAEPKKRAKKVTAVVPPPE